MKLILVRHGETPWNKERRCQGISDVELSENGIKQAEKLGAALKTEKIDAIYTSPLKRAFQTALKISVHHNATITVKAELQELNQGDFEGLTIKELTEKHAEFLKKWLLDPAACVMPNGESLTMLQDRAWPVIERIIKSNRNTLVVAHNFTLMTIICKFLNISLSEFRKVHIDTAAINVVTIDRGNPIVSLLNDTSHLTDN